MSQVAIVKYKYKKSLKPWMISMHKYNTHEIAERKDGRSISIAKEHMIYRKITHIHVRVVQNRI